MTTNFPTPPTFASPIVVNSQNGENQFNPIWLQWFLVLAQTLEGTTVGRLKDIISVTSTGIYNPSSGVNNVLAFAWGAGGNGGQAAATAAGQISVGGGGGAGGLAWGILNSGFSGQTFTIGGPSGSSGGTGGSSTFVSLTGAGGLGGTNGTAVSAPGFVAGGAGGYGSGGSHPGYGQSGGSGIILSSAVAESGAGAGSQWGLGGAARTTQGPGNIATGAVAGGGGALSVNGGVVEGGGAGALGFGLILELS